MKEKQRIAVISDDLNTSRALEYILEAADFEIQLICDHPQFHQRMEAWETAKDAIDLLIVDVETPGVAEDGWFDEINALGSRVPIFAINGYGVRNWEARRFQHRWSAYLEKPFNADSFLNAVRNLLIDQRTHPRNGTDDSDIA